MSVSILKIGTINASGEELDPSVLPEDETTITVHGFLESSLSGTSCKFHENYVEANDFYEL